MLTVAVEKLDADEFSLSLYQIVSTLKRSSFGTFVILQRDSDREIHMLFFNLLDLMLFLWLGVR